MLGSIFKRQKPIPAPVARPANGGVAGAMSDRAPISPEPTKVAEIGKPTQANSEPTRTGDKPTRSAYDTEWHTPAEHASALMSWLHGPGGRQGWLAAAELRDMHREMASELRWAAVSWDGVGRELRKLLDQPKHYQWRNGQQVRVYRIESPQPKLATVDGEAVVRRAV